MPTAIADDGTVVGYCGIAGVNSTMVAWHDAAPAELGKLPKGNYAQPWAINSLSGTIVGYGDIGDMQPKALLMTPTGAIEVDPSGGSNQYATGVTDGGAIFGNFSTSGNPSLDKMNPVFWIEDLPGHPGRFNRTLLPTVGGTVNGAFVRAVAPSGLAVGALISDTFAASGSTGRAGMWMTDAAHTLVVLDTLTDPITARAFNGIANGVSGNGTAVGSVSGQTNTLATLWMNDAAHTLIVLGDGMLQGDVQGNAWSINNAGQVVGVSSTTNVADAAGRAFIYQNGTMLDLATLVDPADGAWALDKAVGINNQGWIIAVGTKNGAASAVVLMQVAAASCSPLSVTQSSVGGAVVQAGFSGQVSATGGTPPYAFALGNASAMPPGLTLAASGAIAGVPTSAGDFSYGVNATDAFNCSGPATLSLHVDKASSRSRSVRCPITCSATRRSSWARAAVRPANPSPSAPPVSAASRIMK